MPFEVTIFTFVLQLLVTGHTHRHRFSDVVFLLSGLVNVVLFATTPRILPPQSMRFYRWSISRPQELPPTADDNGGDPYYQATYVQPEVKKNLSRPSSYSSVDGSLVGSSSSHQADAKRTRREKSRPPDIIISRDSVESMYSVHEEEEVRDMKRSALQPQLSSQWSPDGSPQRRYASCTCFRYTPHAVHFRSWRY